MVLGIGSTGHGSPLMSTELEEQTRYSNIGTKRLLADRRLLFGDLTPLTVALHENAGQAGAATLHLPGIPNPDRELRVGHSRVAVNSDGEIRRLHFHHDDLALNVSQTRQRLVFAFDMAVVAGVQVIRG